MVRRREVRRGCEMTGRKRVELKPFELDPTIRTEVMLKSDF